MSDLERLKQVVKDNPLVLGVSASNIDNTFRVLLYRYDKQMLDTTQIEGIEVRCYYHKWIAQHMEQWCKPDCKCKKLEVKSGT